ncbi:MAG: hypothetical protein ACPGPC_01915 [Alphaproteobacteria bacterium]
MQAYNVQKLIFHMNTRPAVYERYGSDRAVLFAEYKLTAAEQDYIETMNVGALFEMGVQPQLLAPFAGRENIAWPEYIKGMETPGPLLKRDS